MKIAATVQYDGSAYHGFQIQKGYITIQEKLEKALAIYFRNPIRVHPAGRTDTGVHSLGQVVHFIVDDQRLPDEDALGKAIYSLNCILHKDISIVHAAFVDDNFHARFSCKQRKYVYRVVNSDYQMAFYPNFLWIRKKLNLRAMEEAASYLIGEHDFVSFTKEKYAKKGEKTIRRMDLIEMKTRGPLVFLHYHASGFLHNMIRILSGTLLSIGKEEIPPNTVKHILDSRKRIEAGVTLPAYPLVFLEAVYKDYRTPPELLKIL